MWAFKRQAPHLPNPSLHGCGNGRSCVIICTRALQDTLPITLKQQVQRYSDLRFHKNAQWSQAGGAQKSQQLAAGLVCSNEAGLLSSSCLGHAITSNQVSQKDSLASDACHARRLCQRRP